MSAGGAAEQSPVKILQHAAIDSADFAAYQRVLVQRLIDHSPVGFRVILEQHRIECDARQPAHDFDFGAFDIHFQYVGARGSTLGALLQCNNVNATAPRRVWSSRVHARYGCASNPLNGETAFLR